MAASEKLKLTWSDPPPVLKTGGGTPTHKDPELTSRWAAEAAALRERPGRWAILHPEEVTPRTKYNLAVNIRLGRLSAFGDGFQAVVRKGRVYVRFEGEVSESEQ